MDPHDIDKIAESIAKDFFSAIDKMLKKIYENEDLNSKYTLEEFRKKIHNLINY